MSAIYFLTNPFLTTNVPGWEKAEAEAIAIKTELDDTLHQKAMVEQRICQLDEALNVAAEERELLIKDTAQIISCEKDKVWNLEQNVAEKENIIASLDDEYSRLSEILSAKEKIILDRSHFLHIFFFYSVFSRCLTLMLFHAPYNVEEEKDRSNG